MSKCSFAQTEVAYLGHKVSKDGVAVDEDRIKAIVHWSQPTSVKALRGLLGLAGCYRKFVKEFGLLAAPLTSLLHRNCFSWTSEATFTPILILQDFFVPFVIE